MQVKGGFIFPPTTKLLPSLRVGIPCSTERSVGVQTSGLLALEQETAGAERKQQREKHTHMSSVNK